MTRVARSADPSDCVQITLDQYLRYTLSKPPDFFLALADESVGPTVSQKRITKSMIRSEQHLRQTVESLRGNPEASCSLVAPLVGGAVEAARREYSRTISPPVSSSLSRNGREQVIIDSISGFSINLNTLRSSDIAASLASSSESVTSLIRASLDSLPPSKFRLAACPQAPHEILRLVANNGIDLFIDEWSSTLSGLGIALNFQFPIPSHTSNGTGSEGGGRIEVQQDLGINLFDVGYVDAFDPLGSAPLMSSLASAGYSGETLGDLPTRAYLHHLLHTHEMTAHVLLAMHNTCVMDYFMACVRQSIARGTLEEDVEAFHAFYSEELVCLRQAKESWSKVNRERGKGRLKGLGQERREDTDTPSGAGSTQTGTPAAEQERMSFKDPEDDLEARLKAAGLN